ncbi:pyruvate phosphate dikinase, PEP/pyruvate binding domain protein [Desulfitobacterium hafniense DP7]|uniref:Pyruvate phosphate dikinase, PEP/pyruvate binding domain protein n=1 Tax=Desulfitobacterium hafniense DP7 TaxID=537010 RepID=G9XQG6_DESHA|nr:phosphoenolpyruvate synthase [Desulfitobacterium hafniense]EHL06126.1 pyruvate phosphate dikinase, PEP/pyruvate binding domain protein [Desulfitobacterium hafniense DP7]
MEEHYTLFFNDIDQRDLPLVGGKGANLGEMTKAGFPVPYGFCVTTASYQEFLRANNLPAYIAETIKDAGLETIKTIGSAIRERLRMAEIPQSVKEAVLQALQKSGAQHYYAVRSSATAEDLAFASFAGQQDTYLNIKGEEEVLDALRNCWASLFTDRAILYRMQNGIDQEKVYMSVVVQKMIFPEVSGIMFTADPVSGHRGLISIDAGYGLGEALVSGLVSPDIYTFNKASGQIQSKSIAEKKLAILPVPGGGTEKVAITGEKATRQVLDDSLIQDLAELGKAIEQHYGCPQDIEWCLSSGLSADGSPTLSILQSRAITSLYPLPTPLPQDDALHVYVSLNHIQVMTDPISPLGIDMLRLMLPFDKSACSAEEYQRVKEAAGRVYIDISEILALKTARKAFPLFFKNVDALAAEAMTELTNRTGFTDRIKKDEKTVKAFKSFFKPIVFKAIQAILFKRPEGAIQSIHDYIENRVRDAEKAIEQAKPGTDRLEAIRRTADFTADFKNLLPRLMPAIVSFKALEHWEEKLLGSRNYTSILVTGLEGNITTEMGLLIGDLADQVRRSPDLIHEFENEDYGTLFTRIHNLPGHETFKEAFCTFMAKYDMRAAGEIDMAKDRWIEHPEPLAKSILAIVHSAPEGIHRQEYQLTKEKALKAADDLVKEVADKHGLLKAKLVRRLIRIVRNYLPVREHPKYLIMKLILLCKRAFLAEAKYLVEKGLLATEKDIFYVNFWELYQAIQDNHSLTGLVEQRKEECRHYKKLSAPRLLTSDGEEPKASYQREDLPVGSLIGMPVSSGRVEGIARVVTDPAQASVNKGEILVAPFTDPGWTPLFINASGLVMEVGGLLTHGTVVAREYGIPAVVGITDVTKKIRTGQKIRVEGDAGYILILDE